VSGGRGAVALRKSRLILRPAGGAAATLPLSYLWGVRDRCGHPSRPASWGGCRRVWTDATIGKSISTFPEFPREVVGNQRRRYGAAEPQASNGTGSTHRAACHAPICVPHVAEYVYVT
jgi:hypothetical protein